MDTDSVFFFQSVQIFSCGNADYLNNAVRVINWSFAVHFQNMCERLRLHWFAIYHESIHVEYHSFYHRFEYIPQIVIVKLLPKEGGFAVGAGVAEGLFEVGHGDFAALEGREPWVV